MINQAVNYPADLSKQKRLLKAAQFQQVFSNKTHHFSNRYLRVIVAPNDIQHWRLGLAISKKAAKRAVDRNRIKRHIRETFRVQFAQTDIARAYDLVIMAKPDAKKACNADLRTATKQLFIDIASKC